MNWIERIAFRRLKQLCVAGLVVALCVGQPALCAAAWAVLSPTAGSTIANAVPLSMNGTGTPLTGATYYTKLYSEVSMVYEGDGIANWMMGGNWNGVASFYPTTRMFYTSGAAKAQILQFLPGSGWVIKASNDVTVS